MLSKLNLSSFGKPDVLANFYCLYGEVGLEHAQGISEWILQSNLAPVEEQPDILNLFVCSPGGDLNYAWAIIDLIRGSHIPVRIVGLGQIASAGLLIFMSGQKGSRILTDNTSVMSHQFGWGSIGKHHELVAIQSEYTNTHSRLVNHIVKCTGLSKDEVDKKLMPASDVYLTAKDAVKLGIADKVSSLK